MKKRRWKIILFFFLGLVILFPAAFIYVLNNGLPWMNYIVEKDVTKHLSDMGYKKEDISEQHVVRPKMIINKDFYHTHYIAIFKDEPNINYYYGKKKATGEVIQFCEKDKREAEVTEYTLDKTKHSERSCISIFANRD